MDYKIENKLNNISLLIFEGFHAAKDWHELIFAENRKSNVNLALIFLNQANAFITSAKAIYVQFSTESKVQELENFFIQFSVFNKEILTNARTDHDHQWTDIEFKQLKKDFKVLTDLLNMCNM